LDDKANSDNVVESFIPYLQKEESIDSFIDASNRLKSKLLEEREMSASEWIGNQISKSKND
jgi:hypothetical protein